jgi:hypothetical protein
MFDYAWTGYIAAACVGLGYFAFAKRRFDFLSIAFAGAIFYFLPLITGHVLQSSPDLTDSIQPTVYLIATTYVLSLIAASLIADRFVPDVRAKTESRTLSAYSLVLAICGLAGALIQSRGFVIQFDKTAAMQQIGILFVLFEIGASLACIAAVVERRWWVVAASAFLLSIDLLAGFRLDVTLTALAVIAVLLSREGSVRLCRKTLSYGLAAAVLVSAMLLTHTIRFAVFDQIASREGGPAEERITKTFQMRSDTLQFQSMTAAQFALPKWIAVPFNLIQQSEPFMVQATLVGVVQAGMSCSASNILKSAWLLVPPGLSRLAPANPYPPTFYDEYQPILYPDVTYGTGGNIWAEILCRFGYVGLAIFGLTLITILIGLSQLLVVVPLSFTAPIALIGTVFAFYIHRNDLHYTLVMVKQIVYVFALAYGLALTVAVLKKRHA